MAVVVDANVLLFSADPSSPFHATARDATRWLLAGGELLYIVPQSVYEFWAVATRPVNVRGLGMTPAQAQAELSNIKSLFRFLPDTPAIFPEWEKLATQYGVSGKNTHDTRYAAAMAVHGVTNILTFNGGDFKRFQHVTVIEPHTVTQPPPPQTPTS
jgi:predicted nucleic acid-binding protein